MIALFRFLCILLLASTTIACGNLNRTPRYNLGADGMPKTFKRYPAYDEQDYVNRWRGNSWYPRVKEIEGPMSADMAETLRRHGHPDYIRYRFYSETNELVDSWAWWDRDVTVQFVQRQLVFEGPLTDMDKYLIRYGWPQHARAYHPVNGQRRDLWTYQGIWNTPLKHVTFANEKLASEFHY